MYQNPQGGTSGVFYLRLFGAWEKVPQTKIIRYPKWWFDGDLVW